MPHKDRYQSFAELKRYEQEGRDFRIVVEWRERSTVLVLAPHGGSIEPGTSEVARAVAGDNFSLYAFEGTKQNCNYETLHITSHRFDEPQCLKLLQRAETVLTIHGCRGDQSFVCVGGADIALRAIIAEALRAAGCTVRKDGHTYPGEDSGNICNRGRTAKGVQLELSKALRERADDLRRFTDAVRSVLLALERRGITSASTCRSPSAPAGEARNR